MFHQNSARAKAQKEFFISSSSYCLAFRFRDNLLRNLPARLVPRPPHDNRSHSQFALCRACSLYELAGERPAPVRKGFAFVSLSFKIFLKFNFILVA